MPLGVINQSAVHFSTMNICCGEGLAGRATFERQAQAVHPHIVVDVIIAFFHLRGGTCLVDLMQTWDSVCNACFYHAQV